MWNAAKNDVFFQRLQNWTREIQSLLEERDRLVAIYQNEANGDPAFVDTSIATTAEAADLATNVMVPFNNFINNGVVATADRVPFMTPFLVEQ